MKLAVTVLLCVTSCLLTGCGTLLVRPNDDFSGRLYPATVVDAFGFVDGCRSAQPGLAAQTGLSLPFDMIIDTLCLPFDAYRTITNKKDLTLEQRRELRDKQPKEQEANQRFEAIGDPGSPQPQP